MSNAGKKPYNPKDFIGHAEARREVKDGIVLYSRSKLVALLYYVRNKAIDDCIKEGKKMGIDLEEILLPLKKKIN